MQLRLGRMTWLLSLVNKSNSYVNAGSYCHKRQLLVSSSMSHQARAARLHDLLHPRLVHCIRDYQ